MLIRLMFGSVLATIFFYETNKKNTFVEISYRTFEHFTWKVVAIKDKFKGGNFFWFVYRFFSDEFIHTNSNKNQSLRVRIHTNFLMRTDLYLFILTFDWKPRPSIYSNQATQWCCTCECIRVCVCARVSVKCRAVGSKSSVCRIYFHGPYGNSVLCVCV